MSRREWLNGTRLVAAREAKDRLRSRALRYSTGFTLLLVIAAIAIPSIRNEGPRTYDIGLVGNTRNVAAAAETAGAVVGARANLVEQDSLKAAEGALRGGDLDIVVVDGRQLVVRYGFAPGDTARMARFVAVLGQALRLPALLDAAGVPPDKAEALLRGASPGVRALEPPRADPVERVVAFAGVAVLFMLVIQYGGWVLAAVVEEKSTRIVEVLLSTLRPGQLMAGKVVGIGGIALVHGLVIVATAIATAAAVGSATFFRYTSISSLLAAAGWFLLGYALYCNIYAAAGSLVMKVQDAPTLVVMAPMMLGYFTASTAIGSSEPSLLVRVLAMVPLTAPFDMPVLIALGEAAPWQVGLSIGLTLLTIAGIASLAGRVYSRSILRTNRRVPWREALRPAA